ncbi:type II toxin-antitoxin system VapB family antitoxin [Amaricoccus sp.]|uniref:type II toxin-antitoxin system VapB family antitoxin n=1 Tax=Amaricoccus sp. TaxID=1872485 RepID=UPI0026080702|nr:type II toxin-antitoxin system VapB family antitoxin [Amaricoccus sp.]HRO10747.1 type II toxin-antitoxin system VapB family antitoxin [Amaricoccus sp.]
MRTVSIFRNNRNQAVRLPKDLEFPGVTELSIERRGDALILRPVRPSWTSFADEPAADADFLRERPDLIEEGRFDFGGDDAPR